MVTPTAARASLLLLLAAISVPVAGCGSSDSGLTGETWAVSEARVAVDQGTIGKWIAAPQSAHYTVRFDANGTLAGMADCNQFAGTYKMSGKDQLTIQLGPSTVMACPDDPAGSLFTAALSRIATYTVPSAGHLTLTTADGGGMDFVPLLSLPTPGPTVSATPPFEPSASAGSAAPSASASPSPTATPKPSATPRPTAASTATPAPSPTERPSAAPTPSPSPIALGASCTSTSGGVVVAYPDGWHTVSADVPDFACAVFDPAEIVIDPATGLPGHAAVHVREIPTVAARDVVTALTNPTVWTEAQTKAAKVAGLPATLVTAVANGAGALPAGSVAYTYVVDRGTLGVLVISTSAKAEDETAPATRAVVDAMAAAILVKAPR